MNKFSVSTAGQLVFFTIAKLAVQYFWLGIGFLTLIPSAVVASAKQLANNLLLLEATFAINTDQSLAECHLPSPPAAFTCTDTSRTFFLPYLAQ
jgi:hypothetical protein